MKKVAIVIPAYNEEKRIGITLKEYFDFFGDLKKKGKLDFEIIVVLNACKDNTKGVVEEFDHEELVVLNFERGGKGFAVLEGFKEAISRKADPIGFVDADNATPPNAFYGLVRNLGNYDGIIANRWNRMSLIEPKRKPLFRIRSSVFNFIVRSLFLFNYRDTQCGAKLFKREVVEKISAKLGSSGWSFDVDMLFYTRYFGFKIRSIPTEWYDRTGSKIQARTPGLMLYSIIRLRLVHSILSDFTRIYTMLPKRFKFH